MSGLRLFKADIEIGTERRRRDRYEFVPFEVPEGTALLKLRYSVEGDAKVDIGLFEGGSGGSSSRPEISAFRGWSGADRRSVLTGVPLSTPGYRCSSVGAGVWSIALGFPRVDGPARVAIEVQMADDAESVDLEGERFLRGGLPVLPFDLEAARETVRTIQGVPISGGLPGHRAGLLCGDFHTHSQHSGDAETPVVEMVAAAEARHMDFLAITDHNTDTHWAEIDALQPHTGVTLIKGQEVTTYYGHFNAFSVGQIVDFRIENDADLAKSIERARGGAGLLSVNHPKHIGPSWRLPYHEGFEAIEAWQAPWLWFNNESLRRWDRLLRSGRKLAGIGGSDVHDLRAIPAHQYGCPATWVYTARPKSPESILDAVRRGAVCITATPDSPIVIVEQRGNGGAPQRWLPAMGNTACDGGEIRARVLGSTGRLVVRLVGENGRVEEWVAGKGDSERKIEKPAGFGAWLRAELWGRGMYMGGPLGAAEPALVSITNPVFMRG